LFFLQLVLSVDIAFGNRLPMHKQLHHEKPLREALDRELT
jgi:hypothetical protein